MIQRERVRFLGNRLLQFVPVILLATFIVFGLMQLVPGDIAVTLAGENASQARIAEIRGLYGLDRPMLVQYGDWLWNALHGDLSRSILSGAPVLDTIARTFPLTLLIVGYAMVLSLAIGLPLGVLAATRPGSRIDGFVTGLASVGIAVPNFWLAMLLVSYFALQLGWFPATGAVAFGDDPWGALHAATLPAVALASGGIADVARQLRSALIEVLSSQYVRTLRAKGLSDTAILWKHGLKNVSVTMLTVTGLVFNRLLGATVVVEAVFAIPGIGSSVVYAAIHKDFPVIQGAVLVMVLVVISVNLLIDLFYTILDPRVARR
ncbi:ABC transporter permease [Verticiella sediminum]|uniref:ABC transporter permease n=1 Tax=Verticiella sediminum TaxID=1247510 RepID=A0A556AGA0_9BURK|nr:ABC transporter permease [Verticiella sediminum]TSH91906.1 ABC transporter permease [Verticiella sediminum]